MTRSQRRAQYCRAKAGSIVVTLIRVFLGEKSREKVGKFKENLKREKNRKELGRTDGKFEISRSRSPYPQFLVPNGPL